MLDNDIGAMTIKEEYRNAIDQMSDKLRLRRYSESTHRVYSTMFKKFLGYAYPRPLDEIDEGLIMEYLKELVVIRKVSASYQNQAINAIKFYNEHVLGLDRAYYEIDRPLKPRRLPKVLSQTEIQKILMSIKNIKHKAILSTIYGCGLRISECVDLRLIDIDSESNRIWIRNSKGRKDRITLLSHTGLRSGSLKAQKRDNTVPLAYAKYS